MDAVSMAAATVARATLTSVEAESAVAIAMRQGTAAAVAAEAAAEAAAEVDGLGLVAVPWAAGSVRSAATAHCLCSRTWLRWRSGTCVWQVVEALVVAGLVIKVAVGSRGRCGDLR
eukprot:COSAG01_NODE_13632_length_1556_cov_1.831846_3_plen_116_part_00